MDSRDSSRHGPRSGVATFVLVASRLKNVPAFGGESVRQGPKERTARFDLPSEAVRAAVAAVAADPTCYAAVDTGELSGPNLDLTLRRLDAIASRGQAGQVLVSLASQELARTFLPPDFRFTSLGSFDLGSLDLGSGDRGAGRVERLFLVEHERLERQARVRAEQREAASRAARPVRNSRPVTSFVGRARELEELRSMLDTSRLVTVVGTTGIGKSALIRRLAANVSGDFPDGVAEIDLSQLGRLELVVPTLLRVLDAPKLSGEDHADALLAFLRHRRLLLVLDNAEHIVRDVRRLVAELIDECPNLQVLVGSQKPLRLPGEARFKVEGLETPAVMEDWRAMLEYDAIALFVDRAQLVDAKFRLTESNATSVAALCARLDGIPLAIEFAAGKTHILSPRQILGRLDDRFFLLRERDSERPDRQRTLKSMVDWGFSLLRPEAQTLLRRLAVFTGAFSVDLAVEVCADDRLSADAALTGFEELVEGSMLNPSTSRGPERRFHLSETVRIYARQRLKEAGEGPQFVERHRMWCERLCESAPSGLQGTEQLDWLDRLDANYEDVRNAIETSMASRSGGLRALRMLLSVHPYFFLRHYLVEGLRITSRAIDRPNIPPCPELARAMNLASAFALPLGDIDAAREYALRSVAMGRRLQEKSLVARARNTLAFVEEESGRNLRARRHHIAACGVFRALGQEPLLVRNLVNLGGLEATLGLISEARESLDEAELLLQRNPEPGMQAYLHLNYSHADIAAELGKPALRHLREALTLFDAIQDLSGLATCLRNAAYALNLIGSDDIAAVFVGAARASARRMEHKVRPDEEKSFQRLAAKIESAMGPEKYRQRLFEGSEVTFSELVSVLVMIN